MDPCSSVPVHVSPCQSMSVQATLATICSSACHARAATGIEEAGHGTEDGQQLVDQVNLQPFPRWSNFWT